METDIPVWSQKQLALKRGDEEKRDRREIFTLAVLFAFFHLTFPWWFTPFYSEFSYYLYPFIALSNAESVGAFGIEPAWPFLDYWLEYPPVFPWIAVGIYRLQTLITGPEIGRDQAIIFSRAVSLFLAFVDLANLILIYSIAKKIRDHKFAVRTAVVYAMLFFPLVVMSSYFDSFVLLTILLSLWMLIKRRVELSAVVMGVGFMTKFIPLALIFVALKFVTRIPKQVTAQQEPAPGNALGGTDWNRLAGYFGTLLLTVIVLSTAFAFVRPGLFFMPFRVAAKRPGWETLRALAGGQKSFGRVGPTEKYMAKHPGPEYVKGVMEEMLAGDQRPDEEQEKRADGLMRAVGQICKQLQIPESDYLRMVSRFSTRLDYLEPQYLEHGGKDPLKWPMVIIVGVLFICVWLWMPEDPTPLNLTALTGITFIALFLYSPGWSPQFLIYVLPFVLVALAWRTNIAMALIISAITFAELPVWLLLLRAYGADKVAPLLWVIVVLRMAFFVLIAASLYVRAISGKQSE